MKTRLLLSLVVLLFLANVLPAQIIYVNQNASGTNDGTSWTNAYPNLQDALINANTNDEIWIATATYKPSNANRGITYGVSASGLKLYGGFNGTETQLSQRDVIANPTILSGDLQGNDNGILTYFNSTRAENSTRIMTITVNDIIIDGLTFTGGHANISGRVAGAAIFKVDGVQRLTIRNCTFFRNIARNTGGAISATFNQAASELNIENCIFQENVSRNGGGIYAVMSNDASAGAFTVNASNSLFIKNETQNIGDPGRAGSSAYIVDGKGTSFIVNWNNNTHAQNAEKGTEFSFTNSINPRTTLGVGGAGQNAFLNISNSIFWDNTFFNNFNTTTETAFGLGYLNRPVPFNNITHSVDNRNFGQSGGTVVNIQDNDPLFIDAANNDFGLNLTSPYIDTGLNSTVVGTTDVVGNPRVFNTTVDIGAYENQQSIPPPCNVNIPDTNFKSELVNNSAINTNGDNEIQCSEATAYTGAIDVFSKNISDVTGIEAFVNATQFYCYDNQITSIDISQNIALINFSCSFNLITTIDLSQNINLEKVYVQNNNLTSLDMRNGNNTAITNFDARNNTNLTCISVDDVTYSTANWMDIDVQTSFSANCSACVVTIPDTNFKNALVNNLSINTNGNAEIECSEASNFTGSISVGNQGISDLTGIEAFVNLTSLNAVSNNLTSVDLSANLVLTELVLNANQLASINLGNNTNLEIFGCDSNLLTSLDVSANTGLTVLRCHNNQITSLDVSNNVALQSLWISNNDITDFEVTQNTALTDFRAAMNQLTTLDMRNGNNTSITIFTATGNPNLNCISVDDVAYATTNWTGIDPQTSFSSNCSLGIDDFDINKVEIFPNPTASTLNVTTNLDIKLIEVYSIQGQKILSTKEKTIDVKELSDGIYVLKLQSESGKTLIKRFIKE